MGFRYTTTSTETEQRQQSRADLFQLWNALAGLNASVEQRNQNGLKVLERSTVVNTLSIGHEVHEEQRITTWPGHVHTYTRWTEKTSADNILFCIHTQLRLIILLKNYRPRMMANTICAKRYQHCTVM